MKILSQFNGCSEEYRLNVSTMTFNGGEENVRIELGSAAERTDHPHTVRIETKLTSSTKVMQLALAVDAIRNLFGSKVDIELRALYFPYARQDRVCNKGEALSVKVMSNLINAMGFSEVVVADAHSDVTTALLDNVTNLSQVDIIGLSSLRYSTTNPFTLVAPDAGAAKKTHALAKAIGCKDVVQGEKLRNMATGQIIRTELNGDVDGKDLVIVDDVCDGGRTFLELAKVAKARGAQSITLYVTHGIFSQGMSVFAGLIDTVYTTNSFHSRKELEELNNSSVELHVIEL